MIPTVINRIVHTAAASAQSPQENFRLNDAINKISDNQATSLSPNVGGVELIAAVVTLFVVLLILSFVGQLLWNAFIAGTAGNSGLITIARPASSVWQILGLYIFVALLFG
jgi:hypothetical protein